MPKVFPCCTGMSDIFREVGGWSTKHKMCSDVIWNYRATSGLCMKWVNTMSSTTSPTPTTCTTWAGIGIWVSTIPQINLMYSLKTTPNSQRMSPVTGQFKESKTFQIRFSNRHFVQQLNAIRVNHHSNFLIYMVDLKININMNYVSCRENPIKT